MTRGRPRQFDKEAALTRAMTMFWANGYAGTSLSDLTRAMKIAPPSFYAAFGSKDALYEECLKLFVTCHGGKMWEHLASTASVRDTIPAFLRTSAITFAGSPHPPGCMVIAGLQEMGHGATSSATWLRSQWTTNHRTMRDRFERAVAEGDAPDGFDCKVAADFVLTLQTGLSNAARLSLSRARLLCVANYGGQAINAMLNAA